MLAVEGFEPTSVMQTPAKSTSGNQIVASQTNPAAGFGPFFGGRGPDSSTGAGFGQFRPMGRAKLAFSWPFRLGLSLPVDSTLSPALIWPRGASRA